MSADSEEPEGAVQPTSLKERLRRAAGRGLSASRSAMEDLRDEAVERARQASAAAQDGAQRVKLAAQEGYQHAASVAGRTVERMGEESALATTKLSEGAGAIAAFLALPELLKWSESLTESAATIYDKALDAQYLRDHIGGGTHRMFDGGHDLLNAWTRVRAASDQDTFGEEVLSYVQALWKDGTTARGLPFASWDKAAYDQMADRLSAVPGVSRAWVYDLFSYDVFEVFSAGLGAVGILFAFQHDDLERLSELLGTMGITSVISANPIMGLTVIVSTGYAFWRTKQTGGSLELSGGKMAVGASLAGLSAGIFAVLGLPILVEMGIVISVSQLTRQHVLENKALHAIIAAKITSSGEGMKQTVQRLMVGFNRTSETEEQLTMIGVQTTFLE